LSPGLVLLLASAAGLASAWLAWKGIERALEREAQRVGTIIVPFRPPVFCCRACNTPVGLAHDGCVMGHRNEVGKLCTGSGEWP
jgi:hypothetical protein